VVDSANASTATGSASAVQAAVNGSSNSAVAAAHSLNTVQPLAPLCPAIAGAWTPASAGGCTNFHTWRRNPQYHIHFSPAAPAASVITASTSDVSTNLISSSSSTSVNIDTADREHARGDRSDTCEIVITLTRSVPANLSKEQAASAADHPMVVYVLRQGERCLSWPLCPARC